MTEQNISQLQQKRAEIKKLLWLEAGLSVLALMGSLWGLKDWLSPLVPTSEVWLLPGSFISLVAFSGGFAFGIQELCANARALNNKQAEQITVDVDETP